jgi:ATP-dependent Lon protease
LVVINSWQQTVLTLSKIRLFMAHWCSESQVIFPEANRHDYEELAADLKQGLSAHFVSHYDEVFKLAFEYEEEGSEQQSLSSSAASSA